MDIEVIKPNEYVRTEKGYISQNLTTIPWIAKDTTIDGDLVAKHSKNIIDLIEVGDFVNEKKVIKIRQGGWGIQLILLGKNEIIMSNKKSIKTILTHEQYERNCYRLEE